MIKVTTDVTWKEDDKPLAASVAGQPRGDCPLYSGFQVSQSELKCRENANAHMGK